MKGYVQGSKFPLVEISGRKVPRVVLGQHPYDGVTYTSWERDQQYLRRWNGPRSMVELMKPVVQRFGLTASRRVPSETKLSEWHLEALRITMEELDTEIALVLGSGVPTNVQPETAEYVYRLSLRLAERQFPALWREDPIVRYGFERRRATKADLDKFVRKATALPVAPPPEWKSVTVDYEKLDALLNQYRDFKVPLYASHAGIEFLVLARRFDELSEVSELVRRRIGNFFLGTHYAGLIVPMAEEAKVRVDGYLTPINEAGIYMFPNQRLAVQAIRRAKKPVIAIKPLGGGRVEPARAFRYVFHEIGVPVSMVGVGSMEEAEETLGAAQKVFKEL